MKLFKAAALAGALAVSGCVDVDLTTTITGADQASVTGNMTIQRQMLEMMGGTDAFCSADDGGTLVMTDTEARCDLAVSGTFAEVFEKNPEEPHPVATDLGDGTVRVTFPLSEMTAESEQMRADPQVAQMMRPMLEGHVFTIRVAGAEIVSSTGTINDARTEASWTFNLIDILDADVQMPDTFETVVRY